MTCARTRKNLAEFARWANAHPFAGDCSEVGRWVADGVEAVAGVRPMTINDKIAAAMLGDKIPPSWTPRGAAQRLHRAVQYLPQVRRALARSEASLAMKKAAFFAALSEPDARVLRAWMDAPMAAIEGREVNAAPIGDAKAAVVVAGFAVAKAARRRD